MTPKERAILEAYFSWSKLPHNMYRERQSAWERYVAIRDGKEPPPRARPTTHKDITGPESDFRVSTFNNPKRFVQ